MRHSHSNDFHGPATTTIASIASILSSLLDTKSPLTPGDLFSIGNPIPFVMDFFAIPLLTQGRIFGFLSDTDLITLKKVSTGMDQAVSLFFEPSLVEDVLHPTPSVKVMCFRRYGHTHPLQGYEMALSSQDSGEDCHPKIITKVSRTMKKVLEFIIDLDHRFRTSQPTLNIQEFTSPHKEARGAGIACPLIWSSRCGKEMVAANEGYPLFTHVHTVNGSEKTCCPETAIRINGERLLTQIQGHLLYLDLRTDRVSWIERGIESCKRFGIVLKSEHWFSFCLRHIDLATREGNYVELFEEDITTRERKWTGVRVNIFLNWDIPEVPCHQPLIWGVQIETPAAKGVDALTTLDFRMSEILGMWLDQVDGGPELLFIVVQRGVERKFAVYTMSVTSLNPPLTSFLNVKTDNSQINDLLENEPNLEHFKIVHKYCEEEGKMKLIIINYKRDLMKKYFDASRPFRALNRSLNSGR